MSAAQAPRGRRHWVGTSAQAGREDCRNKRTAPRVRADVLWVCEHEVLRVQQPAVVVLVLTWTRAAPLVAARQGRRAPIHGPMSLQRADGGRSPINVSAVADRVPRRTPKNSHQQEMPETAFPQTVIFLDRYHSIGPTGRRRSVALMISV